MLHSLSARATRDLSASWQSMVARVPWVPLLRAVWIAILTVQAAVLVAGLPEQYRQLSTVCARDWCAEGQLTAGAIAQLEAAGLSPTLYALFAFSLPLVIALLGMGLATVMVFRGDDPFALALTVGIGACAANASGASWALAANGQLQLWQVAALYAPSLLAFGGLAHAYFPHGSHVVPWSWLILPWSLGIFLLQGWPDLFGQPELSAWLIWINHHLIASFLFVGLILYRRARTPDPGARRKLLWLALGFSVFYPIGWIVEGLRWAFPNQMAPGSAFGLFEGTAWALAVITAILLLSLAVLDDRLTGIQSIINRTLVFAVLTGGLLVIYLVTIGAFGILFHVAGNGVVATAATLVVALAFAPLRARLQRGVERLLYGDRDDPYRALSRLSRQADTESSPETLLTTVATVVQDAMRVPYVEIRASPHDPQDTTTAASVGQPGGEIVWLPLRYGDDQVGELGLAARAPAERFSPADRRLLDDLCRQAALVLHAITLNVDLQRSRQRLVNAREEERRRLRRDIHDGLGPSLASMTLQAEIARDLVGEDPVRSAALLDDVVAQARAAITDIRRLVYDLRPPALDDLGLAGAIRAQASRYEGSGLRVEIRTALPPAPLPAAVEVATYRIVQEALTNVVRHACATHAIVAIQAKADRQLAIDITDDGRGIASGTTRGVGLTSMRERALELGGQLAVSDLPGGGTRVRARLPTVVDGRPVEPMATAD